MQVPQEKAGKGGCLGGGGGSRAADYEGAFDEAHLVSAVGLDVACVGPFFGLQAES